jgi:hypothetical protein
MQRRLLFVLSTFSLASLIQFDICIRLEISCFINSNVDDAPANENSTDLDEAERDGMEGAPYLPFLERMASTLTSFVTQTLLCLSCASLAHSGNIASAFELIVIWLLYEFE